MLIEELFSRGIMTMGPSRVDPARQIGVFSPQAVAGLPAARESALDTFRWLAGEWKYENAVPATRFNPAYSDIGKQRFVVSDGWVRGVAPDGTAMPMITFDPFSGHWIYLLMRGSYAMLRSREGWSGNAISFSGLMTMIGMECDWRMTWTKTGDDRFGFVNEERAPDGTWSYIDEWRFTRA